MILSTSEFIKLYKNFPGEVTDIDFAEYINDLGYRTTQGTEFNSKSIRKRRIDNGIKSKAPLEYGATKTLKSFKEEAKTLGINIKGLTKKEIKNKVRNRRGNIIKTERRRTDPVYAEKIAKAKRDWAKANPEKVEASQYAFNQKRYLEQGIPPPVKTAKEALWRDLFVTAQNQKVNNRLKLDKKYSKYISLNEFLNAKIIDKETGKTITFKNLEKYINLKNTGFNYEDVIKPYEQKIFINKTPGLRNEINSKLIKNWNAGDKRNFFEVQHVAGRYNDPFNVHLSNADVNLKESQVRNNFEESWNNSKTLSEKKKAFQIYKESLPSGIASQPAMVTRTRDFGERLPLDEMLRETKARGVNLPRGILKNVRQEFENNTNNICSIFGKANGGSVKACLTSFDNAVKNNPEGLFQKILNFAKSPGVKTFGAGAAIGTAVGLVKLFKNDDPTTYLSNEDQQKNMLVDMATQPISIDTERPAILDYQLPALGATLAASTAAVAPSTIRASRTTKQFASRAEGIERKKPTGPVKTGLRVLGRGLGVAASPALLAPFAVGDIASQIAEGDTPTDIATDPLNYLYPAFAEQTPKLTRGLSPTLRKVARLGLSGPALRILSRAGIGGFAASAAIQGLGLLDD